MAPSLPSRVVKYFLTILWIVAVGYALLIFRRVKTWTAAQSISRGC